MSYQDTAALVHDPVFQGRVIAAASEQALIFVDDSRPEFTVVSLSVILFPSNGMPLVNLVAGQPLIGGESTDADLLAALQSVWPKYGRAMIDASSTPA